MSLYRKFKSDLVEHEQGQVPLKLKLRDRRFIGKILLFSIPTLIVGVVFAGLIYLEVFIFQNQEITTKIIKEQEAYAQSLADNMRDNPWGKLQSDNPKAYILSLLLGMNSELRKKLSEILDQLPPEKLNFLAALLNSVELSEAQIARFAAILEKILTGELSGKKLEILIDLAMSAQARKEAGLAGVDGAAEGQTQAELEKMGAEVGGQSPEALELIALLENDPDSIDELVSSLLNIPPEIYAEYMMLMSSLDPKARREFLGIIPGLPRFQVRNGVMGLLKMDKKLRAPFIHVLYKIDDPRVTGQGFDGSKKLPKAYADMYGEFANKTSDPEKMIYLLDYLIDDDIENAKNILNKNPEVSQSVADKGIKLLTELPDQYKSRVSQVIGNISGEGYEDMVQVADPLDTASRKASIGILEDLQTTQDQEDLLREAVPLETPNAKKAIEVFKDVGTNYVRKTVKISQTISNKYKNKLANQTHRIKKAKKESFSIKSPTAVAGVRGKYTSQGLSKSRQKYGDHYYTNESAELQTEKADNQMDRIRRVVDRLTEIDDPTITTDLLEVSTNIDDEALVKGSDVFTKLDIKSDRKRARKLVDIYKRVDKERKQESIAVLKDMTATHVNAAITLATHADDKLLNESIDYTQQLRSYLGHGSGVETTMRAINMASLVDTNKERQRGLEALKQEREITVKRILVQTDATIAIKRDTEAEGIAEFLAVGRDGELLRPEERVDGVTYLDELPDSSQYYNSVVPILKDGEKQRAFTGDHINRMVDLYHNDRANNPGAGPSQTTLGRQLASTLASYDGVTLGATGSAGVSRFVTQPRKITRILQYLEESESEFQDRLEIIGRRGLNVEHTTVKDNDVFENEGIPAPGIYDPDNIKTKDKKN
ncbi:MAG: hypothetical protein HQL32_04535 [Planctomycetes bacterium]|nr:hypothetical protein [Planctomycetota bacterium]